MFKFSPPGWRSKGGDGETGSLLFIANNDITIKFNRTGKEIQKNKIKVKLQVYVHLFIISHFLFWEIVLVHR